MAGAVPNKRAWLDYAELFDTWRLVPRAILFGYCYWVAHVTDGTMYWYQHLPANERTIEASGLAGAIITAVTGLLPWIYRIYSDNSNNWNGSQQTTTTASVTTQKVGNP